MIHKEGYRSVLLTFIFFLALVLVVTLAFGVNWITLSVDVVLLGFFCFVAYFFRDPHRKVSEYLPGEVVKIAEVEEGEFLKSKCLQVSVFMSIWSVHVNYYPVCGDVVYSKHHQGKYLVAWHPKSSEKNERTSVGIKTDSGKMLFMRQIAGCRKTDRMLCKRGRQGCYRRSDGLHKVRKQGGFLPPSRIQDTCQGG